MDHFTSQGRAAFASAVSLSVLAGMAVSLRMLAKTVVKAGYGADDWWIIFGLLSFYVSEGVLIWGNSCSLS